MKILLVDDDKVDRKAITRTLLKSELSVEITEALTVDEGMKLYAQQHFDVVLLDYRMPQRDGIEMIFEIRNEPKDDSTAIVMMSSSEDEELAINCIKAGAQDFLIKSEITASRLRRAIQHATTRFTLEKELYKTYQRAKNLAETDSLTGLPNRYYFDEALKQTIAGNRREEQRLALLLLDLDNFKLVNDNFGHDVGDVLLKQIVTRIRGCLRDNELFARLGGDEFAICLNNLESSEQASIVAQRILERLNAPILIGKVCINTSVSIGISIHPDNGMTSEELFKFADIAMYRSKKLGRNQVSFFEEEMQLKFKQRMLIENELRNGLVHNEFSLFFQPIIDPLDNRLVGFEALLRWHTNGLLRMPDEFMSVAEETYLIIEIGMKVAEQAIQTLSKWNADRAIPLRMAINVSPIQLRDEQFVIKLLELFKKHGVAPDLIDIEITETALFENTKTSRDIIEQLNTVGCKVSLDDFGTGYSSIAHLRQYPISVLKIDKSLMPSELNEAKNRALIEGVVTMAKKLELDIVAEGVETLEHVELCKQLDIHSTQGFHYSKPLSASKIEEEYLCLT